MIGTLAWKEYREHRTVWVAMLALTALMAYGLAYLLTSGGTAAGVDRLWPVSTVVLGMAGTYGLVCGAMMLAGEEEAKTLSFLDTLPARRSQLWVIKVVVGLALALAQGVALAGLVAPLRIGPWPLTASHWYWLLPVVSCQGFIWGLCGSALCRHVLPAVLLSFGLLVVCWSLGGALIPLALEGVRQLTPVPHYMNTLLIVYATALVGLGISWAIFCRRDWEPQEAAAAESSTDAEGASSLAGWRSLLWLTARQGRGLAGGLGLAGLLLGFLLPVYGLALWPAFTLLAGVLCGTAMFANEQMEGAFRFLGSQRLPLGRFWLVKLACWLAVAAGAAGLMFLAGAIRLGATNQEVWSGILTSQRNTGKELVLQLLGDSRGVRAMGWGNFLTVCLVYGLAIGQILALVARKPAVGAVIAILLSLIVVGLWFPSLLLGGVKPWQVLAVPLLLVAAGRLALWPWAGDRLHTRTPGLALAGCAALAAAWIAGNLWYRTVQIPDVSDPVDVVAYEAGLPTPEQNKAGRLIVAAAREFTDHAKEVGDPPAQAQKPSGARGMAQVGSRYTEQLAPILEGGWPAAKPDLGRWMDRMLEGDWAKHLQEAAALPLGVVVDPLTAGPHTSLVPVETSRQMARVLTARALQLQTRGNSAGALDQLLWVLALSRNLRHRALQTSYRVGTAVEEVALGGLDLWIDKLGPRPKLLRAALAELTRHEEQTPPPVEYVEAEYVNLRRRFADLPRDRFGSVNTAHDRLDAELLTLAWQTPWEQARHRRILNGLFARYLATVATADYGVKMNRFHEWGHFVGSRLDAAGGAGPELLYLASSFYWWSEELEPRALCSVRAERLKLALALYRLHEGRLARALGDLVPHYLPSLPLDPFSGKSFHYRVSKGEGIKKQARTAPGEGPRWESQQVHAGQGVIWSVGPDRVDNGGVDQGLHAESWWSASGLDLIYLVPYWPAR